MAIRGKPGKLARRSTQKNTGRTKILNPLARNGPPHIGSQPEWAKGEAGRAGPLACLQNYVF